MSKIFTITLQSLRELVSFSGTLKSDGFMRYLFLLIFLLIQVSFAGMYAITETGEKVFLRDDGTWNKVKGKEADHVDLKGNPLKLNVKFKNRSILEMEKRNELLPQRCL